MPITHSVPKVFKTAILDGKHLPGHTYKAALIKVGASGTYDENTASYTELVANGDEVANGNGYTTGGAALAGRAVALAGSVGYLSWNDPTWAAASISAIGMLIYNDSLAGKDVLAVIDFGGTITSTNDTFTADLPAPGAAALLRVA